MIEQVQDLEPETLARYGAVIDVRSPAEFAADRIPGAINLPVLSNEERAEVGTIYVRESRFRARRIGAAHVARNIARHLDSALAGKDAKFRPLVYCWRGGMRSNAMAAVLSQIGWRVGVLEGGYKTWRRSVVSMLFDSAAPLNLVLVDGETGAGKTEVLNQMAAHGVQIVDLEELAAHRGSVFGGRPSREQPTQKFFESLLFEKLRRLDQSAAIAVEAESAKIGRLNIPKRFWSAMLAAPRIQIAAAVDARANHIVQTYADVIESPESLASAIERLRPFHSKETIDAWMRLAEGGSYRLLAARLMREHYDPLYDRARKRSSRRPIGVINIERFDKIGIDAAAREGARLIMAMSTRSPRG